MQQTPPNIYENMWTVEVNVDAADSSEHLREYVDCRS